ncbi:MAG: hypothetical protein J2P19_03130 [Pseudonocardia sp.]|nr:hypothetical protein [Pseudonocardia sp.]
MARGKTVRVDLPRRVETGRDGWLVAGTFDQHRRDMDFSAIYQALGALGRLLLAEPGDDVMAIAIGSWLPSTRARAVASPK